MYFFESFWGSRVQLGHACTECAGLPIQLLTDDAWQGFQSGALTGLLSESSMLRRCCINAAVELQSGLHLSHAQVSRGNDGDSEEGMQASSSRGLLISTAFLARDGMLISMQREYDAGGSLTEVRSRSAVRGGWVPM